MKMRPNLAWWGLTEYKMLCEHSYLSVFYSLVNQKV
jgi:hypothetical protein